MLIQLKYTKRITKFVWATFEYHWDLLLRGCAKRREKETQKQHLQFFYENVYCPTNTTSKT